jgi:hypothetical protein
VRHNAFPVPQRTGAHLVVVPVSSRLDARRPVDKPAT